MKFQNLLTRITGISTPFGGVSWAQRPTEYGIALELLMTLEDRRILFGMLDMEVPDQCRRSVLAIRELLSSQIARLEDPNRSLGQSLRAMRAACRKFLDEDQEYQRLIVDQEGEHWIGHKWTWIDALGQMRGVFGIHIAKIAFEYELDVPDTLVRILPGKTDEDSA